METLIPEIIDWIKHQPVWSIYFILLFIAYLENVIPPIPGDVLVVFGGYLVAEQVLNFWAILFATSVGSVVGFMNLYYFGYLAGDNIRSEGTSAWFFRLIKPSYLAKTERWMIRWGQGVVLINRFLTGARSLISLVAGMTRLSPRRTSVYASLGATVWNGLLIGAGWFIGDNWLVIQQYLNLYGQLILILIVILIAVRVGLYLIRRKPRFSR